LQGGSEGFGKAWVRVFAEFEIVQSKTATPNVFGKVAHGAEEQHDACFMTPNLGGLMCHFGHPKRIVFWVSTFKEGAIPIQLIAEHDTECAHALVFIGCGLRASRRQRSEQ
jgi:hypothetical protein